MKIIVKDKLDEDPECVRIFSNYKEAFEDLAEQMELIVKVEE